MKNRMPAFRWIEVGVLAFALCANPTAARAVPDGPCYVDIDAAGAYDGSSWTDAYTLLQAALGDIDCEQIWVAVGRYLPGGAVTDTFNVTAGKQVYGGFIGGETLLSQRDPYANITILSGDIDTNDTNTDGNNIAEDTSHIQGNNAHHVVYMDGSSTHITSTTVLDGFTITAGRANGATWVDKVGGGMVCKGTSGVCSPTLANLVFSGNYGVEAAGALFNIGDAGVSSPSLMDVTFTGNRAVNVGGAVYNSADAGTSSPALTRVTFAHNQAAIGGAMAMWASTAGTANAVLTNVTFAYNSASSGAGMWTYSDGGTASPALMNVTFRANTASSGGGALYCKSAIPGVSSPILTNVVLWGDSGGSTPEIRSDGGTPIISHSVVQGGCPAGSSCSALITSDPRLGNLADNTGFTQTMALMAGSSAIDAGSGCAAADQRGILRPHGAGCDIGAYEQVPYAPSDFDHDGKSDPIKFDGSNSAWWLRSSDSTWEGAYLGAGTYVRRSDFDGDGMTDPAKFDASSALWYVKSHDHAFTGQYMGPGTYTFVAGSDYEGDGRTDPAQFNTVVNALWYFGSNDSTWHGTYLGPGSYTYVTGSDFDGDGKSDPAHFNYGNNVLWYMKSSDSTWHGVFTGPGTYNYVEASDFDGDGKSDAAQFTASSNTLWYVPSSGGGVVGVWMGGTPLSYVPAADFDGDGMTDPAGFDPAAHLLWYLASGGGGWQTFDMEAGTYTIEN